jgi:hypothetical protein
MDNPTRNTGGSSAPAGALGLSLTRNLGDLRARKGPSIWWRVRNFVRYQFRELPALVAYRLLGSIFGLVHIESALHLVVQHADGSITDYGVVSRRVITTAGVNFIVDAFQNLVEPENMKFHGFGTGTNAEAVGDTALQTELTTQYVSDNVRQTGSQTEGAANVYRTVATLSPDSGGTIAITEHGIFTQAATGGGTLLDRSVFSAVNLVAGSDSLQATYDLTVTSGG